MKQQKALEEGHSSLGFERSWAFCLNLSRICRDNLPFYFSDSIYGFSFQLSAQTLSCQSDEGSSNVSKPISAGLAHHLKAAVQIVISELDCIMERMLTKDETGKNARKLTARKDITGIFCELSDDNKETVFLQIKATNKPNQVESTVS